MPFTIKQLIRPHAIFLLTGILFLATGLLSHDRTLDINIHDTYFIIAYEHVGLAFFVIYGFYALVYVLIRNYQYRWLSLCHYLFSLPLFLTIYLHAFFMFDAAPQRYYTNRQPVFAGNNSFIDDPRMLLLLVFVIAQLFFIIHLILVFIRAYRTRRS